MIRDHINWIRLWCLTILLGVQSYSSFGQGGYQEYLATPSAHAMSLAKFAVTPVSLYSGTANISIPICGISGVNVSVGYQTSGIRVQDIAGPVGLGWTLNAGGAITRVMKSRPDEQTNDGWCSNNKQGHNIANYIQSQGDLNIGHIAEGNIDTQPDQFYFNVGGVSGMFVLTPDGEPRLIPHQDVKISPAIGSQAQQNYWILTTPDGTQYHFGKNGDALERSEYTSSVKNSRVESFISSWYLSEIVDPMGKKVTFSYDIGSDYTYKNYSERASVEYATAPVFGEVTGTRSAVVIENTITIKAAKRIQKIQSAQGSIEFNFVNARADITGAKYVQSILLKNAQGSTLKTFNLSYSYFKGYFNNANHLKLDAIQEAGFPAYRFTYNNLELPPRDVFQIDHWGYYNNNTYTRTYYSAIPGYTNPNGVWEAGANREADASRAKACILEKVQYPTGGYTAYEYELNSFLHNSSEVKGGGLRIRKMTIYDGLDLSKNREVNYEYNFGATTSGVFNGSYPYNYEYIRTRTPQNGYTYKKYSRTSDPLNFWNGGMNPVVGYSQVTVREAGNGKTIHKFYNSNDTGHQDELPYKYYHKYSEVHGAGHTRASYGQDNTIVTMTPPSSFHWRRGIAKENEVYTEGGKLLKKQTFEYQAGSSKGEIKALTAFTINVSGTGLKTYEIVYGVYKIRSEEYRLVRTIETNYTDNNPVTSTTQTTELTYGSNHTQPIETKVIHPGGFETVTKTKFAADYQFNVVPNTADVANWAIYSMKNKYMLTPVIEQTTWRRFKTGNPLYIQAGKITEFKVQNGIILPAKDYTFESNIPVAESAYTASNTGYGVQKDSRYYINPQGDLTYNDEGQVIASTPYKGLPSSVIWGEYSQEEQYNTRPIAKVANAAPGSVAYTSFEKNSLGNWSILGVNLLQSCDQQYSECMNSSNYPPADKPSICEGIRQSCLANAGIIVSGGYTGEKALYRASGTTTLEKSSLVVGSYIVSLWAKGSGSISITGGNAQAVSANWAQYRWVVSSSVNGKIQVSVPAGIYVDELRLHPSDAYMTSYTFKNGVGLSSANSPQGIITFYEYDTQNRLKLVKDHKHNIVKLHQYAYHTDYDFTYVQVSDFTTRFNTGIPGDIGTLGYSYHWSFGDGTTLVTTNSEITHNYVNVNNYFDVTLEIKDANSQVISTKSHRIYSHGANGNLTITHSTANPSVCIHRFTAGPGSLATNGNFEYRWVIEGVSYTTTAAAQLHTFSQCIVTEAYPITLSIVNKLTGVIIASVTSNVTINSNSSGGGGSGGSGGVMLDPVGPNPPTYEQINEQL